MRKELLKKFKQRVNDHNIFTITSKSSILLISSWLISEKRFSMYAVGKKEIAKFYFSETLYEKEAYSFFRDYIKNRTVLLDFEKEVDEIFYEIKVFYSRNIVKEIKELTKKELLQTIKKANDLLNKVCFLTLKIENLNDQVLKLVAQNQGIEYKSLISDFQKAQDRNYSSIEKRYLFEKISVAKSFKEEEIKKLKYVYTNYSESKSFSYIKKDLDKYKNKSLPKLNKFKLKDFENTEEFFAYIYTLRDYRKDYISMCQSIIYEFTKEYFKSCKLEIKYLQYVSVLEILKGESYLKKIFNDIKKRPLGFEYFVVSDEEFFVKSSKLSKQESDNFLGLNSEHNMIKGFIASKTSEKLIKGLVKIIFDPQKQDFNKGEILVTSMTRPEFLPLMKKAKAIITDEGGITSHAAIVSRELDKPCVIGTKNATQVLKDGDLVEVDANKGVVRKLS